MPSSSRRSATSSTTDCVSETESSTRSSGLSRWNSQSSTGRTIAAGPVEAPSSSVPRSGAVGLGELLEQLLLEREHPLRAAVEAQPGLGRLDPPPGAVEQLRPEPLLERAHLLADRRLGDAEPRRRLGEAPALDDLAERCQLARVHKRSLSTCAVRVAWRCASGSTSPTRRTCSSSGR